ncbi:hypothetical protein [Helicobacter turcicus]|uniref:Periplasmic protein n=1 Tax=Helicobacter turcicus TaxID=2867412 RepID=A0ABS7JLY5_9HELI|nr:hypothetical protein [Helicobacter turcicus]MBX7490404.1 hypothetical protein [Helicobacter turcicus]MBX7545262.1 hypothetical protein [Helicobacter turcicus]
MSNFKFVIYTLVFSVFLTFLSLGFMYLYDPLQIFHKSYFKEARFFNETRLAARGIIAHYDFDSYILGTSMLQNTSAKEASEKLGGNFVNISPANSSIKERAIILDYLFEHKKPKAIIYSLDGFSDIVKTETNFKVLYDKSFINDFGAYLNDRFILCLLTFSRKEKCIGEEDLETHLQWIKEEKHLQVFGGFENWVKFIPNIFKEQKELKNFIQGKPIEVEFNPNKIDISKQQKFIESYTLSFIKSNPNTNFHLILPPYSRLKFKIDSNAFIERKKLCIWLLHQTKDLKNVTIYGFDTLDYPDSIANYIDLIHYANDMNSLQLDAIQNKTHILTLNNVESYFNALEQKIRNYDLTPLIDIAKNMQSIENTKE